MQSPNEFKLKIHRKSREGPQSYNTKWETFPKVSQEDFHSLGLHFQRLSLSQRANSEVSGLYQGGNEDQKESFKTLLLHSLKFAPILT